MYPDGLHDLLKRVSEDYAPPAIYVTENGAAFGDVRGHDGRVHDPERTAYLRGHIERSSARFADGVPVKGYFVWSLLDNFEWAHGYSKRFGIVYIDYPKLERVPKDSFYWYRDFIASRRGAPRSVTRRRGLTTPHDKLDRNDRFPRRFLRSIHEVDRGRRGERAELLAVLADRRQRRVRERGGLEIVEADDGDVATRPAAGLPDRLQRGERHQVGRSDDCRRRLREGEQRAGLAIAGRGREVAFAHVIVAKLEAEPLDLPAERGRARRARGRVRRAGDVRDPAMAVRVQVRKRKADAAGVIRADERGAWRRST